jgi:membrane-bound metal-dependent hydrolase YbcI (DUF457 family)
VDNLTHGLAGALLAQTGFRQRYGPMAMVALVIGAELPDLDFLFDLGGPIVGFQHHRGITHAFAGALGLALLAAGILYTVLRYRPYWSLVGLLYLGALLHIWMDYLTSYGTQIFLPFDAGRYTADAVFIIDFFYTGLIVTALLVIRMVRRQRQRRYGAVSLVGMAVGVGLWLSAVAIVSQPLLRLALRNLGVHLGLFAAVVMVATQVSRRWPGHRDLALGRYGMAALAAYMGLCMVSHAVAKQRFAETLAPRMADVQRVAAIPLPGGPYRWRGIAETDTAYMVSRIDLVAATVSAPEIVPKGPKDLKVVRATSDYRLVRVFEDFARFPVVEYRWQAGEQVVRYFDLRFTGYGRGRSWFDLEIRLDAGGSVRGIRFLDRVFAPHHPEF